VQITCQISLNVETKELVLKFLDKDADRLEDTKYRCSEIRERATEPLNYRVGYKVLAIIPVHVPLPIAGADNAVRAGNRRGSDRRGVCIADAVHLQLIKK
jgi:hypothetical protein